MWTEFDKVDQSRRTSERDQDEVCKGDFSNLMNVARDRVETDMGGVEGIGRDGTAVARHGTGQYQDR